MTVHLYNPARPALAPFTLIPEGRCSIGFSESALRTHTSRLEAQVAAQAATIAALREEVARKDARIHVLQVALRKVNTPPCPIGQFEHTFQHHELGEMTCHLEHEPAEPEAGWPEQVTLMAAYPLCADIADRLTKDEIERIEIAAAAKTQEAA